MGKSSSAPSEGKRSKQPKTSPSLKSREAPEFKARKQVAEPSKSQENFAAPAESAQKKKNKLPKSSIALKRYGDAVAAFDVSPVKEANEIVSKATDLLNEAEEAVKRYPMVVINSKDDLLLCAKLKRKHTYWTVCLKVPTDYEEGGESKPAESELKISAEAAGMNFEMRGTGSSRRRASTSE